MNTTYTVENITDIRNIADIFVHANVASNHVFGLGIVFSFYIILLVTIYRYTMNIRTSLIASSFIAFLFNLVAWTLGLITGIYVILPLLVLIAAITISY